MVEELKGDDYAPTHEEQVLIAKHLGDHAIVDRKFKATVVLSREQADTRKSLIQDVEYDF